MPTPTPSTPFTQSLHTLFLSLTPTLPEDERTRMWDWLLSSFAFYRTLSEAIPASKLSLILAGYAKACLQNMPPSPDDESFSPSAHLGNILGLSMCMILLMDYHARLNPLPTLTLTPPPDSLDREP